MSTSSAYAELADVASAARERLDEAAELAAAMETLERLLQEMESS